jgi:hypothetical protein
MPGLSGHHILTVRQQETWMAGQISPNEHSQASSPKDPAPLPMASENERSTMSAAFSFCDQAGAEMQVDGLLCPHALIAIGADFRPAAS